MEFHKSINTSDVLPAWIIPIDIFQVTLDVFVVLTGLAYLSIILIDKLYKTAPLILIANSCLAELLFSLCMCCINTLTLYYDVNKINSYDWFCFLVGYLSYSTVAMQYYSYLFQALYRYIVVIYPTRLFYQSFEFQALLINTISIFWLVYPVVLLLSGELKYLPDAQICQVSIGFSFTKMITIILIELTPIAGVTIMYVAMVRRVHEMGQRVIPANGLIRAKRELRMVRRLVLLVFSVVVLGIPYMVFFIMSFFNSTPKYYFRFVFAFVSAALILIMISLFQITEPLKVAILKRIRIPQGNVIRPIA